ncbi:MAG: peptidylprolyl isomerase [Ferruginibacter sp.]
MKKLFVIIICIAVASCSQKKYKNPHIIINTRLGDIEVELFPDQAPKTTAAFLSYIDSGFYKNSSFYRVLKTEDFPTPTNTGIIQGGIWQTNPQKKRIVARH